MNGTQFISLILLSNALLIMVGLYFIQKAYDQGYEAGLTDADIDAID